VEEEDDAVRVSVEAGLAGLFFILNFSKFGSIPLVNSICFN